MIKDYIIVGAGPAGLQLGSLMQNAGMDYLILESGEGVGSFFKQYPRHRKLISINKKYTGDTDFERNLRMDWNSLLSDDPSLLFTQYSNKYFPPADRFVEYLEDFSKQQQLNISFNKMVKMIDKSDTFTIETTNGERFECRQLIIATGVSKENIPNIPGIELAENYSTTNIDPDDYINQHVLVIGKGNSAFETADNLIETTASVHVAGRSAIKLAWQTHFVGHLRAVNNNLLDSYQLKSQNAILDGHVVAILKEGNRYKVRFSFSRSNEVEKEIIYDRIITCTGFRFDDSIFTDRCRPNLVIDDRFPELNSHWASVNVPRLHFAGTLMQQRDYKKSTNGFVHGFRYSVRALFHMLRAQYDGIELPHHSLPLDAKVLADAMVERINKTSALWQQFQIMCDSILLGQEQCLYIEELGVDYTHDVFGGSNRSYFNMTLEYGPDHDKVDPFNIEIARVAQNDHENALNAQYLHPVIRFYRAGEWISEHHMAENLENLWNGHESHVLPLRRFLDSCLAQQYAEVQEVEVQEVEVQDSTCA